MLIVRFEDPRGAIRYGTLQTPPADGRVREANLIEGDIFGQFRSTGESVAVDKLLAPVAPPNIFGIGLNYRDHAAESGAPVPSEPAIFLKATTSVIAEREPIVLPVDAPDEVDYEAELAIVIGKRARNVSVDSAAEYVLGYTCGNDVSARDCQARRDIQWARAKSFDTFCPLGPWIVSADGLDPSDLAIKCTVNGQVLQNSRTSQMVFSPGQLVSFLSRQFTLLPGTVIMTGTPPGVGCARKPPIFLRPADEVVVEIERIGRLVNPVLGSE